LIFIFVLFGFRHWKISTGDCVLFHKRVPGPCSYEYSEQRILSEVFGREKSTF
jgi:hypothetical protein